MYQNHTADTPGLGKQINLADAAEVELWSKVFGLPADGLKQAVEVVGPDYGDLVAHLADSRPRTTSAARTGTSGA